MVGAAGLVRNGLRGWSYGILSATLNEGVTQGGEIEKEWLPFSTKDGDVLSFCIFSSLFRISLRQDDMENAHRLMGKYVNSFPFLTFGNGPQCSKILASVPSASVIIIQKKTGLSHSVFFQLN